MRSEAHVKRSIVQKGETSFGRIELHRRCTKVKYNAIHRIPSKQSQLRGQRRIGGLRQMDALFIRSQVLTSERERLRVYIKTQQLPIWRRGLQNSAGVSA